MFSVDDDEMTPAFDSDRRGVPGGLAAALSAVPGSVVGLLATRFSAVQPLTSRTASTRARAREQTAPIDPAICTVPGRSRNMSVTGPFRSVSESKPKMV